MAALNSRTSPTRMIHMPIKNSTSKHIAMFPVVVETLVGKSAGDGMPGSLLASDRDAPAPSDKRQDAYLGTTIPLVHLLISSFGFDFTARQNFSYSST
jgi:hypothetical protein